MQPGSAAAAATRTCALTALAQLRAGAQSGRLAYRALKRGRIGTYRRLLRGAGRAHQAVPALRACASRSPAPPQAPIPSVPPAPTPTPAPAPPKSSEPQPVVREISINGFSAVSYLAGVFGPVPSGGTISPCGIVNELAVEVRSTGIAPASPSITWSLPGGGTFGPVAVRLLPDGWGLPSIRLAQVDQYLPDGEYRVELAYDGTTLATGSVQLACEDQR